MASLHQPSPSARPRKTPKVPKVIRNRDAQRAYRQRQSDRLSQLQADAARLTTELLDALTFMNQKIGAIDAEIAKSQHTLALLPNPESSGDQLCPSCDAAANRFSHRKVRAPDPYSATALCGPPNLDQYLAALLKLSSLRGSFVAQKWVYSFADLCTFSDPFNVRKFFIDSVGCRRHLLDKCSVLDRPSAIEILQQMKDENRNHFDVLFGIMYSHAAMQIDTPLGTTEFQFDLAQESHLKTMRSSINRIESLASHQDLVNELFGQLQLYSTEEREKAFFRVIDLQMRLQDLCADDEDRLKLMLALEIGKAF
ncbi:hypothetical protein HDU83_001784 [Entophlyctis luteolus]|nr:hypothetical protein HDU83_001784 [Entophlyctis luteolus]